jgi:hypothetical protein
VAAKACFRWRFGTFFGFPSGFPLPPAVVNHR